MQHLACHFEVLNATAHLVEDELPAGLLCHIFLSKTNREEVLMTVPHDRGKFESCFDTADVHTM